MTDDDLRDIQRRNRLVLYLVGGFVLLVSFLNAMGV